MLEYATSQYGRHTEWFLRHKESGVTILATILTAESAVVGLFVSNNIKAGGAWPVLMMLAVLSCVIAHLASQSCRRAFVAALEHAALTAKTMWAMGLVSEVRVDQAVVQGDPPFPDDDSMFVPRYYSDARQQARPNTDKYVQFHISKAETTFQSARRTLAAMGLAGALIGLISASITFVMWVTGTGG
jgi:hypothetical protein